MKIVINSQFYHLKDFIDQINNIFLRMGRSIYQGRNEIKVFECNGLQLNVKKYKVPNWFNRIVYSFFRATKAKRAYEYARILLAKGIETPVPVAYIEEKKRGLFSTGYYISLQCPYTHTLRDITLLSESEAREVLAAFARFTARLHDNQILHLDYSPGNILFERIGKELHFSLIDLNRMRFGYVDETGGCRNLVRLWLSEGAYRFIGETYAVARNFNSERCQQKILDYCQEYKKYCKCKDLLKKITKQIDYFFSLQHLHKHICFKK